ncbi:MAG: carboxypeptidase-like regulatory domain-containing protein [Planctomycetota bacterium]|nr:carboxypeptidase-like regulatory domain-containing protein [Planctomycetota bacterium]
MESISKGLVNVLQIFGLSRFRGLLLFFSVSVYVAGCSSKPEVELTTVSGVVTERGQPVGNADVQFYPESEAATSGALTGPDGRFELMYADGRKGASPGSHQVVITTGGMAAEGEAGGGDGPPPAAPAEPVQYRQQVEVSAGPNELKFEISTMTK